MVEAPEQNLEPLPYHVELRDYLKSREREVWDWFASARARADYTEELRLGLLKSTYRLEPDGHAELYQSVAEAKARLGLDIPVTLYQARNSPVPNAALFFIPGEGHIVFSGPIFTLLSVEETKSVIGHELAHYHLWAGHNGDFLIADRMLEAAAGDPRATASHSQTARHYRLYTEVFCDRGSLSVTGDILPVIAGLVKVETGMAQVSAAGYLRQADEIFAKANVASEELSHPETFIRARALALWQNDRENAATQIAAMIENTATLDGLDLAGQARLMRSTRRLLEYLLQPKWFQTPAVLGHARLFFDDFRTKPVRDPAGLDELKFTDAKLREYLCYVLLDFATADPDLDDMPLAAAFDVCRQLELETQFEKIVAKELKIRIRDARKIKDQAAEMLAKAEAAHG